MRVVRVTVRNFRGYQEASAGFGDGLTVITGANGAGKTNLIEALYFGCTGRSCRTANEREVVRFGEGSTRVVVAAEAEDGAHELSVGFAPGEPKRMRVNGASVERIAPSVEPTAHVRLQLRDEDFATASRIAEVINKQFGADKPVAQAENSALVDVNTPAGWRPRMAEFIAAVGELRVEVDMPAKIVVNERTGTIVMGKDVRISPVAILHGNLSVEIQTVLQVSQPGPLSQGKTEVVPEVTVRAKDEPTKSIVMKQGATVEELVRALTAIGSSARDIIAILQNLRAAGALDAELEVI